MSRSTLARPTSQRSTPVIGGAPGARTSGSTISRLIRSAWQRICLVALVVGTLSSPAAALSWSQPEQTKTPSITDTTIPFTFAFTNSGTTPVTITTVKPSCSCTVAHLSKNTYQPGESGTIAVEFMVGSRTGDHTKTIIVSSTEPAAVQDVLILHVKIPPQASFSRRVTSWPVGAAPTPEQIVITIPKDLGMLVQHVDVKSGHGPGCTAVLTTLKSNESYQVTITPTSTSSVGTTTIDVVTNLKTYHVYARITQPAPIPLAVAPHATVVTGPKSKPLSATSTAPSTISATATTAVAAPSAPTSAGAPPAGPASVSAAAAATATPVQP